LKSAFPDYFYIVQQLYRLPFSLLVLPNQRLAAVVFFSTLIDVTYFFPFIPTVKRYASFEFLMLDYVTWFL